MPTSLLQRLASVTSKRLVRRSLITIIALLLLYSVLGFLVLPAVIKHEASKLSREKLHRELLLDKVQFNPFSLDLKAHGLKLMEPQGETTFASFEILHLNVSAKSLLHLAPVVQEVRLTKPYVHLVRTADNHYNIDDIMEMVAKQPPSPEPSRFSVNNIQLDGGEIAFDDQPAKAKHKVTDVKLGVPFISSFPTDVNIFVEPLLSAKVNGSPMLLKGKARPFADTKEAVVDLNLDDLDLTRYLGYAPIRWKAKIPSAQLNTKLTASFRQQKDKTSTLVLNGDASLKAVQINDADGKSVLKVPELSVTLKEMDVFSGHYDIERLGIKGLQANVSRDHGGQMRMNVARLLTPTTSGSSGTPSSAASKSNSAINLRELDIQDASIHYTDDMQAMQASADKIQIALRKLSFDTAKNQLAIDSIASNSANVQVKHGRPEENNTEMTTETKAADKLAGKLFHLDIAHLDIKNWSAHVEDGTGEKSIATTIAPISLSMQNISTNPDTRSKLALTANFNKNGKLTANGTLGITPLHADLLLDATGVDLQPIQPYIADKVNLRLTQAQVSTQSKLVLDTAKDGSLTGSFRGDASINNFSTVDRISSNEFLRWNSLAASGIDVNLAPLSVNIDNLALSDFFARIILDQSGRINLQNIARSSGRQSLTDSTQQKTPSSNKTDNKAKKATPARVTETAQTAAEKVAKNLPPIHIKKVVLQSGRVRFTDNFIKPNYSANMQDLGGTITGLASSQNSNADVNLHGVVNNAPLTIAGRINPLKRDLFLDLKGTVRGMELAQLSAYSDKYIGYGIEKGKLSFEVNYLVDNKQLTASNRLTLDQLTFGKENPDPSIKKLPVKLAVALLADRNGIINVNVPISGSLDDPQFSIGSIVLKIIGNLVMKAVTAPFSFLASAFGGGEHMSMVAFDAGRATIPQREEDKMKSLVKALNDRPAIKLDITGRYDPATDIEGLKMALIDRKVRALKTKDMQAKGQAIPDEGVTVSKDEYPDLLWRVYQDESFSKPRNAIGMQKKLSVEEMRSLMLANTKVDDDDLLSLGNRRAQAAKTWLMKNGVPAERLFIIGTKSKDEGDDKNAEEGSDTKAKENAPFSRVDLSMHS